MLLDATGHAAVYVNGELHTGDPYYLGWLRLPVLVHKGENTLLFHLAADQLSARLTKPPGEVFFMSDDRTLPTLVRGETENVLGSVPVVNATAATGSRAYKCNAAAVELIRFRRRSRRSRPVGTQDRVSNPGRSRRWGRKCPILDALIEIVCR